MEAFVEKFRYKPTKATPGPGAREEAGMKSERVQLPEEKKTVHFNFKQPPAHGRDRGHRRAAW